MKQGIRHRKTKRKKSGKYMGRVVTKGESSVKILFLREKGSTLKKGGISGGVLIKGKNESIKNKEHTDIS